MPAGPSGTKFAEQDIYIAQDIYSSVYLQMEGLGNEPRNLDDFAACGKPRNWAN